MSNFLTPIESDTTSPCPLDGLPSQDPLINGGFMGELIRQHNWQPTALGLPETWPQSLRSTLSLCLQAEFQIAIYWGPQQSLLYNDAWSQILGNKHPWALGRPAQEVWPEIWDTIGPLFAQVMATGNAMRSKDALLAMFRRGFTEECYFDYTFTPIRGEDGAVAGVFNIAVETTFRVLQERRQRLLSELRNATSAAKSAAEVCTFAGPVLAAHTIDLPFSVLYLTEPDPAGNVRRFRRIAVSGLPSDAPAAPEFLELDPNSAWPVQQALSHRAAYLVEDLARRFDQPLPGGPWPEAATHAFVIPIPGLGASDWAGVFLAGLSPRLLLDDDYKRFAEQVTNSLAADIANARAYEQERRRAEALAEIDRAKTTFFSNISHEFRTPLTLMLGPLEDTLRSEQDLSGAARDNLELAHRNGLRLQKLVNALLDFSRIEAGRVKAAYEPTDLPTYTAELASNFRSACQRANLQFVVDCPPMSEPVFVDREMWEKIVLNLVSNAFKFTLAGGIRVSLQPAGSNVQLTVSDTGCGIPAPELPRLFERFHRVEGVVGRTVEGSGIGLALVQELVKMHGGTIQVHSTLGVGSTFIVTIPGATVDPTQAGPVECVSAIPIPLQPGMVTQEALSWLSSQSASVQDSSIRVGARQSISSLDSSSPKGHVLLAEDNADMRQYICRLLSSRFTITAVSNGEAALDAVLASQPDLILADVMMPGLDGFSLLRALRSDHRFSMIPFIIISARAGEESRVEGLDSGADDYLTKPFSARELIARVTSHLEIGRLRKESLEAVKRSEAAARESQRQLIRQISEFETLFLELPVGVAVAQDPDCNIIRINPAFAEMLGMSPNANASKSKPDGESLPFRVFKNGKEIAAEDLPMQVAARERQPVRGFEFDILRDDGQVRNEFGNAIPLFDADGNVRGGVGVFVDISERKLAEESLLKSEAHLRRANQELEQFAYSAAHDLREPLRSVSIYSELLQRRYQGRLDDRADEYLAACRAGAERMDALIRDLLTYAGATSVAEEFAVPVALNRIVDTVLANLRAPILETNADISVGEMPTLTLEAIRFQQIIQNLIENALKYRKLDERPVIRLSAERRSDGWLFSVKDNGVGIDSEHHSLIFGRFKRLHGQKVTGTGLGLAICQRIVEAYCGTIWVESALGQGSDFRFLLPLRLEYFKTAAASGD